MTLASSSLPRGANATLLAAIGAWYAPFGGPSHTPRYGFWQVIGPLHQWRIA